MTINESLLRKEREIIPALFFVLLLVASAKTATKFLYNSETKSTFPFLFIANNTWRKVRP
jgi:hypothetical protein